MELTDKLAAMEELASVVAKLSQGLPLTGDDQQLLDGLCPVGSQPVAGVDSQEQWQITNDLINGDSDAKIQAWNQIEELTSQQQGVLEWPSNDPKPPVAWLLRTLGSVKAAEGDGLRHRHADEKGRQFGSAWMPDHTVTLFTGQGGVGKSRLALQLAVHVARGGGALSIFGGIDDQGPALWTNRDAVGKVIPRSGKVVYAGWETRRAAFWHRAEAVSRRIGGEGYVQEGVPDIAYVDMKRAGALWGVAKSEHIARRGDWLPAADWLLAQAVEVEADLLILDPLAGVYMQSENDRGLVRAFLSSLDSWCEENRCAVLLIAHPPKTGGHAYAGSTDWHAGVQCLWTLDFAMDGDKPKTAGDGEPVLKLSVEKLNEDLRPQAIEIVYKGGRYEEKKGDTDEY